MSSASSSIESPVLTRRTLAWDRTSLLKGMSWDLLRTIVGWVLAMGRVLRDGRPELSLSLQTRHPNPLRPLPLNLACGAGGGAPLRSLFLPPVLFTGLRQGSKPGRAKTPTSPLGGRLGLR